MEPETRDRAGDDPGAGGEGGRAADGRSEVERLRRENGRLTARLEIERRRRERLIDRYEALVPDGSERPDRPGAAGTSGRRTADRSDRPDAGDGDEPGGDTADRGVASAVGYAAWSATTWVRRGLRALRARR